MILQYTSGSTSEPKGVMIPDRVLSANVDACAEAALLSPDDLTLGPHTLQLTIQMPGGTFAFPTITFFVYAAGTGACL